MISQAVRTLWQWLLNRPKRPPGPSWSDIRTEGSQSNAFWSIEYPLKLSEKYGEITYVSAFRQYFITGANGFEHILKANHRNYQRHQFFYKSRMQPLFGKSILVTEGDYWKHRRKIALPVYRQASMKSHFPIITKLSETLIANWQTKCPTQLNILTEMNRLTLKIAFKIFCNAEISEKKLRQIGAALKFCMWYSSHSMFIHPLKPTIGNLRFFWHLKRMDKILLEVIDERYKEPSEAPDLLNHLLKATQIENPSQSLRRADILAEFKSHIITGHETTACTLSWMWYLLALHPAYRQLLEAELITVLNGRTPTLEDIPHLKITRAILFETFRLYPPIWSVARTNVEADTIGGFDIPKNSVLILHLYALHRNPNYWENPNDFRPERFLTEENTRHPFAYLPFNAGPHTCIASHLGIMEAILLAAMISQQFRFELAPKTKVKLEPCISLRPLDGIKMCPKPL